MAAVTTQRPYTAPAAIVIHRAPDVVSFDNYGRGDWKWGDLIEWHVAIVDGEVVGRRRTRDEAVELIRSKQTNAL